MALKRDAILNAKDIQIEEVQIPEWGDSVFVRTMSAYERDSYESGLITGKGADAELNMTNARAKLVAICTVDEAGVRLFTDNDIPALAKKSAIALDRIFTVAQRLSGITKSDIDTLTKNSASDPSANSRSSSL